MNESKEIFEYGSWFVPKCSAVGKYNDEDDEMDNQQVTQTDLAWLGGIWDGEGHFSIRRTKLKKSNTPQYSPRLGVTNSNVQILTKVRQILDVLGIKYYFREKPEGGFEGSKKQTWVIAIETMENSIRLITAIRPYLVGKCFQADCIVEYCENRLKFVSRKMSNKKRKYSAIDYELVRKVFEANGDIRGTSETIVKDAQRAMI
jgi:hypothetical protein